MHATTMLMLAAALAIGAAPAVAAEGGDAAWKQHCAKCHGDAGHADTPAGKAMKATAIAGNDELAAMSADDIVKAVKASPKHAALKLSDDQLQAAAGHAKELAAKK
jgi:mono/diheme cytochrome c family protein